MFVVMVMFSHLYDICCHGNHLYNMFVVMVMLFAVQLVPGEYSLRVTARAPNGQFGEKFVSVTVHEPQRENTPPRPVISPSTNATVCCQTSLSSITNLSPYCPSSFFLTPPLSTFSLFTLFLTLSLYLSLSLSLSLRR